jgi:tRNA(Ile)-lysidine synthase
MVLKEKVKSAFLHGDPIAPGQGVVVAVSGGPDSMALLHLLNELKDELGIRLICATLDHGLRTESSRETDFVKRISHDLGAPFYQEKINVRERARELGISIEQAGRRERYNFLERVRVNSSAEFIATAHHRNDEIETFFLRLFKGSSLDGLSGIPARRGPIIRPLIRAWRAEIISFLKERDMEYMTDKTNLDTNTERNFIRNKIIPVIEEGFPNFQRPMARTISMIHRENSFLSSLAEQGFKETAVIGDNKVEYDLDSVRVMDPVILARVLRIGLYEIGGQNLRISEKHIRSLLGLIYGSTDYGKLDLGKNITACLISGHLTLRCGKISSEPVRDSYEVRISGPGSYQFEQAGVELIFRVVQGPVDFDEWPNLDETEAYFDADQVDFPFIVRSRRPGDRIAPWGGFGSKKLKSLMIDRKLEKGLRQVWPLVTKNDEILWIPGVRRGRGGGVARDTGKILIITLKRNN